MCYLGFIGPVLDSKARFVHTSLFGSICIATGRVVCQFCHHHLSGNIFECHQAGNDVPHPFVNTMVCIVTCPYILELKPESNLCNLELGPPKFRVIKTGLRSEFPGL